MRMRMVRRLSYEWAGACARGAEGVCGDVDGDAEVVARKGNLLDAIAVLVVQPAQLKHANVLRTRMATRRGLRGRAWNEAPRARRRPALPCTGRRRNARRA
eukprot:4696999-Pleurochrysis_carterae.AAC.1